MTYRKNPDPRYDGNGNLKSEFRNAGILAHIARARAAGMPENELDFALGEEARYTELVTRISLMTTYAGTSEGMWELVRQCQEYEGMIGILLEDYGITETAATGELIPRKSKFLDLLARHADHV